MLVRWTMLAVALVLSAPSALAAERKLPKPTVEEHLLASQVKLALMEQLKADALPLTVEVHGARVALEGEVRDRAVRKRAIAAARKVDGVRGVRSRIKLTRHRKLFEETASPATLADRMLETRVQLELVRDLGAPALALQVEARGEEVHLGGLLADGNQRDRAVRLARALCKDRRVRNAIQLDARVQQTAPIEKTPVGPPAGG